MSNPKRILVVDDELPLAMVVARGLKILGEHYHVDTAYSGPEAISLLQQQPYDLLITDHQMPDMSGVDLLRHVQETAPTMRTVMITAHGVSHLRKKMDGVKVDKLLGKPFNIGEFRKTIRGLLGEVEPT